MLGTDQSYMHGITVEMQRKNIISSITKQQIVYAYILHKRSKNTWKKFTGAQIGKVKRLRIVFSKE